MARILIVEDDPLIAMMLEEWLIELGHQSVGPVGNVDDALQMVDQASFDVAILDVNLERERSDAIADRLLSTGHRFCFATGDSLGGIAERFSDKPTLAKPYEFEALRSALDGLLAGH